MPCFYFHLDFGSRLTRDEDGLEFPDLPAATREAERAAQEILLEAIKFRQQPVPEALVIADASGKTVHTLRLDTALPASLKK